MTDTIFSRAKEFAGETIGLRRWFHSHPESSFKEHSTTARIREELTRLGIPFEAAGDTGTIGVIRGTKAFPVLALRADIDALEITEKNETDYTSQNDGLMHACGHDAHTASLLTAAALLYERRDTLQGTVKLIFQPAEELGKGAQTIVESGKLDDVHAFFGIHVRSGLDVGKLALQKGAVMAGANSLHIEVTGRSGHAGHPDDGIDSIAAGAAIIQSLQHIVSREISPTQPAVVSVCQFHAGTRDNIIARDAHITGTVRIASENTRLQIAQAVERIVSGVGAAHRVKTKVTCEFATPVLFNSDELYDIAVKAARTFLPEDAVQGFVPQLGTEDFSRYSKIAPVFFAFVGSGGEFPHHHERFDIDESALPIAVTLYTEFALEYFKSAVL